MVTRMSKSTDSLLYYVGMLSNILLIYSFIDQSDLSVSYYMAWFFGFMFYSSTWRWIETRLGKEQNKSPEYRMVIPYMMISGLLLGALHLLELFQVIDELIWVVIVLYVVSTLLVAFYDKKRDDKLKSSVS